MITVLYCNIGTQYLYNIFLKVYCLLSKYVRDAVLLYWRFNLNQRASCPSNCFTWYSRKSRFFFSKIWAKLFHQINVLYTVKIRKLVLTQSANLNLKVVVLCMYSTYKISLSPLEWPVFFIPDNWDTRLSCCKTFESDQKTGKNLSVRLLQSSILFMVVWLTSNLYLLVTFEIISFELHLHCWKSNLNFCNLTWNVEENQILHETFRVASRFPRYISCYFAESGTVYSTVFCLVILYGMRVGQISSFFCKFL